MHNQSLLPRSSGRIHDYVSHQTNKLILEGILILWFETKYEKDPARVHNMIQP